MTPDQSIGRVITVDQAMEYYQRCIDAEKAMGPLTREDRLVILSTLGETITIEEFTDLIAGKRVLYLKLKENPDASV